MDRLRRDCVALAGTKRQTSRAVGSVGHRAARSMLARRLRDLGVPPAFGDDYTLPYLGRFANIAGRVTGSHRVTHGYASILIGAHYDTCAQTPGADDNAAAVAIVLESARRLRRRTLTRDTIVVFFDAEEPPYFLGEEMGSTRLLADVLLAAKEPAFPLILDLCGHDVALPELASCVAVVGLEGDVRARKAFERAAPPPDLRPLPVPNLVLGGDYSDYHAFNERGLPYVFFSCGEWPDYHAPTDTVDRLNFEKMSRIVEYLESFLRELDGALSRSKLRDDAMREGVMRPLGDSGRRGNDRRRFAATAKWFAARLEPELQRAGLSRTGDLAADLSALRRVLAARGDSSRQGA